LLRAGADKVAVKSLWCENVDTLATIANRYGRQAVVVSVDYLDDYPRRDLVALTEYLVTCGAGEILLTSMDREGTMQGYDLATIKAVSDTVDIPVIAHGGCSGPEDMLKAIEAGASAVAAGALFQFTDWTPKACSQWLLEHGVEARV